MYKKAVASFWSVEEVDLSNDLRDWDRLSSKSVWSCMELRSWTNCRVNLKIPFAQFFGVFSLLTAAIFLNRQRTALPEARFGLLCFLGRNRDGEPCLTLHEWWVGWFKHQIRIILGADCMPCIISLNPTCRTTCRIHNFNPCLVVI